MLVGWLGDVRILQKRPGELPGHQGKTDKTRIWFGKRTSLYCFIVEKDGHFELENQHCMMHFSNFRMRHNNVPVYQLFEDRTQSEHESSSRWTPGLMGMTSSQDTVG